ncbi:MAG: hypothetical protein U5L10_04025 [Candidatus Moranbacteria bacterium]|nr:hypothetical protein [Candidatus Moranbacteria bacterium]
MSIKAVAFDVGGVIGDIQLRQLMLKLGKSFKKSYLSQTFTSLKNLFRKSLQGNADIENFLENLTLSRSDWGDLIKANSGLETQVLQHLGSDIEKFIISNMEELHWSICLEKIPIENYFQENNCILSCRVGALKPQEAMWQKATEIIGRPPKEVLLIDNNPANVKSFIAFGGNAVRYFCRLDSTEKLKNNLISFGVI